jgi:Flp pilus assembly protein TadD
VIKKNILTQGNKIKADRLALENRLEDAQILYAKICKVDPTDAEVWVKLAETQRRLGQYSDAESSGRHAVRLLPNKAQPHHVLAASLHCQGKLDEAITGYRKAIQLQPSYPPSHYLLDNALMELGRLHEAESSLLYTLKLRPNFSAALNDLDWHEALLDYAQQRTIIQTPSYHQVTQPIYEYAKYRWMRYEKDLALVIETLQLFIKHFGYSS